MLSLLVTLLTSKLDHLTIPDKGNSTHIVQVCFNYNYFVIVGAEAVGLLSNRVIQISIQRRFMVDDNSWPPEQPTSFTPLLFIQHQGHRTPEEVTAMAELTYAGDIDKVSSVTGHQLDSQENGQKILDTGKATKDIAEILSPLESGKGSSFILIEGAPGVGKSVLLQEIAYRWANKEILQNFELVLLVCLRSPSLQQIQSVDDLLQLICIGDKHATEIVSACAQYLFANGGRSLLLLFDGYDEYPEHLRESSLVADILKHQVLPHCGLVVSSRPHASVDFHKQATIRVDILGFTETERERYIKQALPDQPHKIKQLTQYLYQQPSIDSICFIPFNMAVLLYLYKLGIALPKNSTELYHHFICSTICRHLSKLGKPLTHNIADLTDLPEPYNRIIKQLSKLSLEALNNNKLIFTLHEITASCPDITSVPGAINGFGLLQAIQHFGLYMKTMTLNFIHFTIQEFLAAHYISHLPPNEELKVIKANFWSNIHFNMFSIYISLTKGQRSSFKTFLSGGNKEIAIADQFLEDWLTCLRLYKSFNEAEDYVMCKRIKQAEIFKSKIINLQGTALTTSDMECISLFLTSSFNKEWKMLSLSSCHIQDKGLNILYNGLHHSNDITIDTMELSWNVLTTRSSSWISELTVKCKVKKLEIYGNRTIGEDQQLYFMLTHPYSELQQLYMMDSKLSSRGARELFTAVKENNKLKALYISGNAITDDACDVITTALESNSCLVELGLYRNPLSTEAIKNIVQCLESNISLQFLGLPYYPRGIQKNILSLQEVVNKKRKRRGCQVKLEIDIIGAVYCYEDT